MSDWLTDEQIEVLRAGFDEEDMYEVMRGGMVSMYAPVSSATDYWHEALLNSENMSPRDRQMILISTIVDHATPMTLGVHVYWGLCAGLNPQEVYQTMLLTSFYVGINRFAEAGFILRDNTWPALREAATLGKKPTPMQVMGLLAKHQ